MDSGIVCCDMRWCWPDPSQVVMDHQHQHLYLGFHIQSNWRGRSIGSEPNRIQVSLLHVHTAFLPELGCGLTLGSYQTSLFSLFQATFLKQGERHWSWGDECIAGRKDLDTRFFVWVRWVYGHGGLWGGWKGDNAPFLTPSPCCSCRLLQRWPKGGQMSCSGKFSLVLRKT